MQTRTYNVYKFDELPAATQAKALDKLRYMNVESPYWYTSVTENAKDHLAEFGYDNADISFTGFASQGDGASFTCTLDMAKLLDMVDSTYKTLYASAYAEAKAGNCSGKITKSGRYEHEMTMSIELSYDGDDEKASMEFDILADIILEHARAEARSIYRDLENEHDMLTDDAQVKETIYANDYDFTESGDID